MRPESKRYLRVAGGVVSAGVLAWVAVGSGPVQAGSPGDDNGTTTTERETDRREGSRLFLSSEEGPPGSKFKIGGRHCVEDFDTVVKLTLFHEDGTQVKVPDGWTDPEGNWEVTAVVPDDMDPGDISIEASCYPDTTGIVGFAQPVPVFNYAGSTFTVTSPTSPEPPEPTEPSGPGEPGGPTGPPAGEPGTEPPAGETAAIPADAAPGVPGEPDFTG